MNPSQVEASSSTIAAIVTSLGGPPGAVGIVRLSGPSAVAIVARVFRPGTKKRKKRKASDWRPTSHVVEYGVVSDRHGNVVDEVHFEIPCVSFRNLSKRIKCKASRLKTFIISQLSRVFSFGI